MTAVEPLDEMRAELEAALPDVRAVAGRAEAMPLPDSSADVVTSAQAFHWFDHDDALPEIVRVLRPGGRLALVWNSRDDRDPWMARLSAIIGNESIEESDVVPILDASGLFGPVETAQFSFEQVLDRDGLLDLVLSRSYLAKLPPPEREPVLDAVGRLYDETAAHDGVRLAYVTECFRADAELVELAADGLDVVAVGVQEERRVVATAVLGAVLLADAWGTVVSCSCLDAGAVEGVDLLA